MKKRPKRKTKAVRATTKKRPAQRASQPAQPTQPSLLPDGKLYYRIGEVSEITGVKPYVLRYWESEFRWMAPQKSRSKQRLYRKKDIETILLIRRMLHEERYTIAGARKRLKELGVDRALEGPSDSGAEVPRSRYREIRDELEAIRAIL